MVDDPDPTDGLDRENEAGPSLNLTQLYDTLGAIGHVLDPLAVAIVAVDRNSRIVLVNSTALGMFGFRRDGLISRSLATLLPGAEIEIRNPEGGRRSARLLRAGKPIGKKTELVGQRSGGQEFRVLAETKAHGIGNDTLAFLVITDLSAAEASDQASRRRDDLLRMVISGVPAMVSAKDREGRYVLINDFQAETFGVSPETAIGKTTSELIGAETGSAVDELDRRMAEGGTPFQTLEEHIADRDGRERVWLTTKSTLRNDAGEIDKVFSVSVDISEKKVLEERAETLVNYDSLTGLPNRPVFLRHFNDTVTQAKRARSRIGVVVLDIDNLREIDNQAGEGLSDGLIRRASIRLSAKLRDSDILARTGNDSFTILVSDHELAKNSMEFAKDVAEALRQPFEHGEDAYSLKVQVGHAVFPEHGLDSRALLQHADNEINRSRSGRPDTLSITPSSEGRQRRRELINAVRAAVEEETLELVYQPEVDLDTGQIARVEALIRGTSKTLLSVTPTEIVATAEEIGMTDALAEWSLRAALESTSGWSGNGRQAPPVSVNLSSAQFYHPELVDIVEDVLGLTGRAPSDLVLEVDEETALLDAELAEHLFHQLAEMGVATSLDKFAAESTSLLWLGRFSVDTLKIDRSVIRNAKEGTAIARAATYLGRGLGKRVVAVGVEEWANLVTAREAGCHGAQGFMLASPMGPDVMAEMIGSGPLLPEES